MRYTVTATIEARHGRNCVHVFASKSFTASYYGTALAEAQAWARTQDQVIEEAHSDADCDSVEIKYSIPRPSERTLQIVPPVPQRRYDASKSGLPFLMEHA